MRNAPTNWNTLMAQQHQTETRVDIDNGNGGVTSYYGYDGNGGIWSLATRNALFENFGAGNCHSGQIDLTLVPQISHWWKKSKIGYVAFEPAGEIFIYPEDEITLYRRIEVTNYHAIFGGTVEGVDAVTINGSQIDTYFTQGYIYTGEPNMIFEIDSIEWDDDEEAFLINGKQSVYSDIEPLPQFDDVEMCKGIDDGEVSNSEANAYPQYGAQGGFWYSYTGERAATIPPMAKMEVYVRLTNGTLTTSWVRKGVYFIDTREWDAQREFLTITGYDAMLKAEQPYYKPPVTITGWPKLDTAVVAEICTRLGVTLDSRTVLDKGYMVQLPAVSTDGEGSDSLRTTLGYIGAAYGGNWIITDEGELRLVPLKSTATPIELGTNGIDLQTFPAYDALGIVHVVVSEDAEYTAGTDGRDIEVSCPWGTQTMANNLLTALQGYVYQPLTITTEYAADPLYELGDNITFNGYTSVIADETINFSLAYTADFAAPNGEEIEHEYPYQGKEQQEIKRIVARSTASLKIDIDEIKGEVSGLAPLYVPGTRYDRNKIVYKDGKYYKCVVNQSSTTWVASEWAEQTNGAMSSIISQTLGAITLTATAGQNQSTISITADGVVFDTEVVEFSSITADKIKTGTLDATDITLDGLLKVMSGATQGGYLGYGYGNDGNTNTNGVVLASASEQAYGSGDYYVIVTNGGVRMTAGTNSLYCTSNGVYKVVNGVHTEIGEAVFG